MNYFANALSGTFLADYRLEVFGQGLDVWFQGREQIVEGKELLARAFQHEMDHLDGMLFLDRVRGIKRDLIVKKIRKLTRAGKW